MTWGRIEVRKSFDGPPKNGKPRVIPLHPELAPILRAWLSRCPPTPEGLVFLLRTNRGYRPAVQTDTGDLRLVLTAAGCPSHLERPWRDAPYLPTMFCEAGGSPDALSRILGHTGGGGNAITAGYVHVSMDYPSA